MKKLYYLIVLALILGLVLTGCFLSNIGQVPTSEQSGIASLTKGTLVPGNLVGLWHFDGDALDSSGHGNDGMVNGAIIWDDGKFGDSLSFYGIDNYVDCGDISTLTGYWANLTTEAWVYWDGSVVSGYAGVYYKAYHNDIGRLLINGVGGILVQNGNGNFFSNSGVVLVNQWCHIVYVYDQSAGMEYIYVNGDKEGEQARGGNIAQNSTAFWIGYGWHGQANHVFSGLIDEVRIWDVALNSTQIAQSYALGTTTLTEVVTVLGEESLAEEGVAIFTSAFYVGRLDVGEEEGKVDVSARAMIVGSDVLVDGFDLRGMTPKGANIGYAIIILDPPDNGF